MLPAYIIICLTTTIWSALRTYINHTGRPTGGLRVQEPVKYQHWQPSQTSLHFCIQSQNTKLSRPQQSSSQLQILVQNSYALPITMQPVRQSHRMSLKSFQ